MLGNHSSCYSVRCLVVLRKPKILVAKTPHSLGDKDPFMQQRQHHGHWCWSVYTKSQYLVSACWCRSVYTTKLVQWLLMLIQFIQKSPPWLLMLMSCYKKVSTMAADVQSPDHQQAWHWYDSPEYQNTVSECRTCQTHWHTFTRGHITTPLSISLASTCCHSLQVKTSVAGVDGIGIVDMSTWRLYGTIW